MPRHSSCSLGARFIETDEEKQVVKSAQQAVHQVLRLGEVELKLKRVLVNALLWQITVAHGKYKTRFRSEEVINGRVALHELRHDHVFTRQGLLDRLLSEPVDAERVEQILNRAIACTISKSEHDQLNPHKDSVGWKRYIRCPTIKVYDCVDEVPRLCSAEALAEQFPSL
jgi:hypothetical protein